MRHHIRGLILTLVGSVVAIASPRMLLADRVAAAPHALVGQMDPPAPAAILGIAGLITAFGGIGLQAYDKYIARRQAELDHQYRLYIARRACDQMGHYAVTSYEYILAIHRICEGAGVKLPPEPGPPPKPPECSHARPDGWHPDPVA